MHQLQHLPPLQPLALVDLQAAVIQAVSNSAVPVQVLSESQATSNLGDDMLTDLPRCRITLPCMSSITLYNIALHFWNHQDTLPSSPGMRMVHSDRLIMHAHITPGLPTKQPCGSARCLYTGIQTASGLCCCYTVASRLGQQAVLAQIKCSQEVGHRSEQIKALIGCNVPERKKRRLGSL